jgi:hypothetical protein
VARPEGNDGEGWRPVVEVGGSQLEKMVGTRQSLGRRRQSVSVAGGGSAVVGDDKARFGGKGMGEVRRREEEPEWAPAFFLFIKIFKHPHFDIRIHYLPNVQILPNFVGR